MSSKVATILVTGVLSLGALECSDSAHDQADGGACAGITIDRFKELEIVDDAVVGDARSLNGLNGPEGPWSFRYIIEQMIPSGSDPSAFVSAWINNWATTKEVNGFTTEQQAADQLMRAAGLNGYLMCPWLQSTASNGCNMDCSTCAGSHLDLAKAPFRLIAITNRLDLGLQPGIPSTLGELRFVFALTQGPADDPASASKNLPMTLITEFSVPENAAASRQAWAQSWHNLGTHTAFDEPFRQDLEALLSPITKRGAAPGQPNGSAIGQVRTNESEFLWIWQLRQFGLDATGQLVLMPVTNTPGASLNDTQALADYVTANRSAVLANKYLVPPSMLSGAADGPRYYWNLNVDEPLRHAFASQTCNGCHGGENEVVDTAFHVSPFKSGVAKLSPFLNNPSDSTHDELANRETILRAALCGN